MSRYIPYPTALLNDANAAGFAETWINKDIKTAFYLMLSNNIGGAVIIDGSPYAGYHHHSGEVGHLCIERNGRPCYCGQKGCVDRYLAATPAVWGQSLSGLGQARVNLSPLLDEAQRRALGVAAVAQLDAAEAANLLQGTDLTGPPLGRLRAAVWQAFALQSQGSLAEAVPQGLRRCSGDLLTDLTALDLEELGRVLAQLADASCSPQADLLPGRWDERTARYELEEDALTFAQALFPLAPQEAGTG